MSQVNPALFSTMNLKTELEVGHGANAGDGAQYLSRVLRKPAMEKPTEIWRTYLRRYDSQSGLSQLSERGQQSYGVPGMWKAPKA